MVFGDQRLGDVFVDVSVVSTVLAEAATRPTIGLDRRERAKHQRYPGRGLYPFVLDVRGRWGREARALVQALVSVLPTEERPDAIRACRRAVSNALQIGVAEQLLTAASGRSPVPAAAVAVRAASAAAAASSRSGLEGPTAL